MSVEIREVVSKRDLHTFVSFPHTLYRENPYWVPALRKDEITTLDKNTNPAFDNCDAKLWLAYRNGEVVGRIAGIINHDFMRKWAHRYARFGWVDFIDDKDVADALFDAVEKWALRKKMTAVHGPLGFTDFDPEGLLLDGFDKPSVMTTIYNYPYYIDHLVRNKYLRDAVWVEFEVNIPTEVPAKIQRMASFARESYRLAPVQAKHAGDLLPYAREVFYLINKTYRHLYGVVDLSERLIDFYLDQFFTFIDPDFTSIIINSENKVVAFAVAMPSLTKALQKSDGRLFPFGWFHLYQAFRHNKVADLYLIAVHPTLRKKGVTGLIIEDLIRKFRKRKIEKAYTHPILEHNGPMINFWKQFERAEFRRRGCFLKHIPEATA